MATAAATASMISIGTLMDASSMLAEGVIATERTVAAFGAAAGLGRAVTGDWVGAAVGRAAAGAAARVAGAAGVAGDGVGAAAGRGAAGAAARGAAGLATGGEEGFSAGCAGD